MQSSIEGRVADLIEEVARVEHESEDVYLALGKLFPAIMSEMDKSARDASTSLDGFKLFVGGKPGTPGRGEMRGIVDLRSMTSFAQESSAYFKSVHDRDAAFLVQINESIERLSSLKDVIGRVRSDSEEMEIISLNAMTVALKSGNAGKAFSVITEDLKRLSSRTITLTESITGRGKDLLECFQGLSESLSELDTFQEAFFGELDRALTSGYSKLESDIRAALDFFGGLIQEARGVRDPVQSIMQAVQLQDIIRQSLQHVNISLEEARNAAALADGTVCADEPPRECAGRIEELAFVAAIADLSTSLVADIVRQLEGGIETFGMMSGAVSFLVEGVEDKRRGFVRDLALSGGDTAADARRFSAGSARYLDLKRKVIQTARRLSDLVRGLDDSFRGLAGILSRFQNIVVASRIEVAKNRSISGVANTVHGMVQLTERIGQDVGVAMDTTKDFIKVVYAAIAEYSGSGGARVASGLAARGAAMSSARSSGSFDRDEGSEENDRLLSTLKRVELDIESLDVARGKVGEAIGGFHLYTPGFIEVIGKVQTQLSELSALATRLHAMEEDLSSLRNSITLEIGADNVEGLIKSSRLRNMIEQFTIFTHKKTAGEIGRFDVEEGVEAGEITLF